MCISDKRRGRGREGAGTGMENNACDSRFLHECTRRASKSFGNASNLFELADFKWLKRCEDSDKLKQITCKYFSLGQGFDWPEHLESLASVNSRQTDRVCLANVFKYQVYLLACKCIRTGLVKKKHCPNCASSRCVRAWLKISLIDYWITQKCCVISWAENWTLSGALEELSKDFGEFSLKPLNTF